MAAAIPDPFQGRPQLRRHAMGDTKEFWASALAPNPLFSHQILSAVIGPSNYERLPVMAYIFANGRANVMDTMQRDQDIMAYAIFEWIAPAIPTECRVTQADAHAMFATAVKALLKRGGGVSSVSRLNAVTFATLGAEGEALPPADAVDTQGAPAASVPIRTISGERFPRDWPFSDTEIEDLTPEACMIILKELAIYCTEDITKIELTMLATTIIAVVKRGTCSIEFANKFRDSMSHDLNLSVSIRPAVVEAVWFAIKHRIDDKVIQVILNYLLTKVPAHATLLHVTLSQAANSGLTAFYTIKEAFTKYPDFPWDRIIPYIPDDFVKYSKAQTLVGNNAYFGYRSDLGDARSTNYKSLAYVAKELLVKVSGNNALARYGGWKGNVQDRVIMDKIIRDYILKRGTM